MSRNRQALFILGLAALLAVAFALFARLAPWHAELAETNYQANLIRLQAFLFGPPPRAVLVGSSMAGRLLPSYFNGTQLAPLANLGLDGSGPSFGLGLVLKRPPPLVIIEENTLLRPDDGNDTLLAATIRSPQFRVSRHLPVLRAQWRPSSILYTWLKLRSQNVGAAPPAPSPPSATPRVPRSAPIASHDPALALVRAKLQVQIQALRACGCRIVLLRLPAGRHSASNSDPASTFGEDFAREFNVPRWDLETECLSRGQVPSYTDGLHLTPSSARGVSRVLAELLVAAP